MKILEVVEGSSHTGSAAAALTSARALAARGHAVTWLCEPGTSLAARGRDAGLRVREELNLSPLGLRRSGRTVRGLSADSDLVHVHRSRSHLAALLALGFSGRSKPLARTCHAGLPGRLGFAGRWLCARAEALVVRSSALAFELGTLPSPEGARLAVIPGGADGEVFGPQVDGSAVRARLGLDGRLVVGTVSHLKSGRRMLGFCLAAERLTKDKAFDSVSFVIIGRGELRKSLERWIDKAGLASRLQIFSPEGEFAQAVAALDVGVLLVPGSDGSARAALEMAALGKPLVVGKVGALADLAGPEGDAAVPVSPDSVEEISGAIGDLAGDAARRKRLGRAARARFEERHSLERLGENYENLFASLTGAAS
jgi:glycosyltransferase involved in cell wall biosynthesis